MLRQWQLKGRHLDVCQVIDHPKFADVIAQYEQEPRYEVFKQLSDLYESEIVLASQYNETLLTIAYGEQFKPFDFDSPMKARGDSRYHLWFHYLINEGYPEEAWELFNAQIYPLCTTLNNSRAEQMQTLARYFNELSVLMQKTKNPEVLYSVTEKTVKNLYDLFLVVVDQDSSIPFETKKEFCENFIFLAMYKNMHHTGIEFYITFNEYFDLNETVTIMNMVSLAEYANDYYAVNVLKGDIQAVKYRIDKYREDLDRNLEKVSAYILAMKERIEDDHGGMIRDDSFIKEGFDFFFTDYEIEAICRADFAALPFYDKDAMFRKLLDAVICFFKEDKALTTEKGVTLEPALSLLISWESGVEGVKLRNRMISLLPHEGIDYRDIIIQDALEQLDEYMTSFYLDDLSADAKQVLEQEKQQQTETAGGHDLLLELKKTFDALEFPEFSTFASEEEKQAAKAGSFSDITASDEVKTLLADAQRQWNEYADFLASGDERSSKDFAVVIANYIQAFEMFLQQHIVKLKETKENLPKIDVYKNERAASVEIGSEDFYEYATLGSFFHYIAQYGTSLIRQGMDKTAVTRYIASWAEAVKAAQFSAHAELSIKETAQLQKRTLLVYKRLAADLERS